MLHGVPEEVFEQLLEARLVRQYRRGGVDHELGAGGLDVARAALGDARELDRVEVVGFLAAPCERQQVSSGTLNRSLEKTPSISWPAWVAGDTSFISVSSAPAHSGS